MRPVDPQSRGAAGYSLIEVLVALAVLSIGILGLAHLQMAGLKYSASAAHRLEAVNQANDILERMRANPFQALDGHYNLEMGEFPQTNGLAQSDLEQWKAALMASLPSGDGSIKVSERVVTITVQWSENWDSTLEGGLARIHLRTQL